MAYAVYMASDLHGTHLIINLHSRRSAENYEELLLASKQYGIHFDEIHELHDGSRLDMVIHKLQQKAPDLVVVAGGDGTVSDVVDGFAGTKTALAIVPFGTTNNFARSLHMPFEVREAVRRIAGAMARPVDLGECNGDYFANVAGLGISAEVAFHVRNKVKKRYGRLAYAMKGLGILWRHKPFHVTITDKDGELKLHYHTHQLIIANGQYHAGTPVAADASVDSRELVIFKLGGTSRLSFVWHMIDFYLGKKKSVAQTSHLIAKDVFIETKQRVRFELDGEVKGSAPLRVRIHPHSILMRY